MGCYFVKAKGWRYDFTRKGSRYTGTWFKTKTEANLAEARRKEELRNPKTGTKTETGVEVQTTPIGMDFLTLLNRWLDQVKIRRTERHYTECRYMAKRWLERWKNLHCQEISVEMIEQFISERGDVSPYTANKELRYLRAVFNFGNKRGYVKDNPAKSVDLLPENREEMYCPPQADLDKVIEAADPDTRDYLLTLRETMARGTEINHLRWKDVYLNVDKPYIDLYTKKAKNGNRTARKVPMTQLLFEILSRRFANRDKHIPWVFYHSYINPKTRQKVVAPYNYRKRIMNTLCDKTGVRHFRFHAFRHAGATLMDSVSVPLGDIQLILGHSNRKTTEGYIHTPPQRGGKAMEMYENARQNSHTDSHMKSHTDIGKGLSHAA